MKQMTKRIGWMAALCLLGMNWVMAQPRPEQQPEHRLRMTIEEHCAELCRMLRVSDDATEQFTATFKAYKQEMIALKKQQRPPHPNRQDAKPECENAVQREPKCGMGQPPKGGEWTDEEIEQRILQRFAMSRAIIEVREKYYHEFRKLMTPRQIEQLYDMEQRNARRMNDEHRRRNEMPRR